MGVRTPPPAKTHTKKEREEKKKEKEREIFLCVFETLNPTC